MAGKELAIKVKHFFLVVIIMALAVSCPDSGDDLDDLYAERMQEFVQDISEYAKNEKSGFIIIPQNGEELAFKYTDLNDGLNDDYIKAIDGVGIEELFYYKTAISSRNYRERLDMLNAIKETGKKIMVSDYVSSGSLSDAIKLSSDNEFISFPRIYSTTEANDNYHYRLIPTFITGENPDSITSLSNAKNYLYLISTDNFATKEAMLNAIADTNYDVVLIDLFYNEDALTQADITDLRNKANGGSRLIIAYINIGAAEKYRYYWQDGWRRGSPSFLKKNYEGYSDEIWVEFWDEDWRDIIFGNDDSYIKKIIDAGFDGAYLDNVEAYYYLLHK